MTSWKYTEVIYKHTSDVVYHPGPTLLTYATRFVQLI